MTHESRRLAGILLILLPTVVIGGVSLLALLLGDSSYMENPLRQDLWRAGHAHAGVLLPLAFFLSVLSPDAQAPNAMIYLAYLGAVLLVGGVFTLGVGLVRSGGAGTE